MKVLLTGSNGYVGGWIATELIGKGYDIAGCGRGDNRNTSVREYYKWDIGREDYPYELEESGFDVLIHAAACKSLDVRDVDLSITNLVGTQRVMNIARKSKCKIVILISGGPVIGKPNDKEVINEEHPLFPQTFYHATKAAQELMVAQLSSDGIKTFILRPSSPIAPIMNDRTIFSIFVERALLGEDIIVNGKGTRRQNYIDLRDLSVAIDLIIRKGNKSGIYNIANNYTVSNLELAEKCVALSKKHSKIVFSGKEDLSDDEVWNFDTKKIYNECGFSAQIVIDDTITGMMNNIMEGKKHV